MPLSFTGNNASVSSTTVGAGSDVTFACGLGGADVVYSFTTSSVQFVTASVNDASNFAGIAVVPLGACSTGTHPCAAPGDDVATVSGQFTAGTWGVVVKSLTGGGGPFALNVTVVPPPTVLTNATARTVSGAGGSTTYYAITVPSGRTQLVISISGGSAGDPDLFVSRSNLPTTAYEYSSAMTGADTVTITNPMAGTYYIGVYGYNVTYSGWALTATY